MGNEDRSIPALLRSLSAKKKEKNPAAAACPSVWARTEAFLFELGASLSVPAPSQSPQISQPSATATIPLWGWCFGFTEKQSHFNPCRIIGDRAVPAPRAHAGAIGTLPRWCWGTGLAEEGAQCCHLCCHCPQAATGGPARCDWGLPSRKAALTRMC